METADLPPVLITHPGRQHSHRAALALEGAGMLAGYWSGVPSVDGHARRIPRRFVRRYATVPLPPERVRWAPWTPALRRLGDRLPAGAARWVDLCACRLFDRWVATRLGRSGARAVLACEISALTTFQAARKLGMVTLLDAPSFHHETQDRVQPTLDSPRLHRRIARIKDLEVALADHVLTVSGLARDSYVAAGCAPHRVHALPLGADLELFRLADADAPVLDEPLTFLFAGAAIHRKGLDLLLPAFERARSYEPGVRLRVVGSRGDASGLLATGLPGVTVVGALDQEGVAGELRRADCLVLPSRHDSFGMVVAEALASGTPVIVSTMVGAKDLVREGVTGWLVPMGDMEALAERMTWCARHASEVRAMGPACRKSALDATWEAYYQRITSLLSRLGSDPAPGPPVLRGEDSAA
jgi:glycosyltransferase involved in cell wall biosynthesis